MATTVLPAAVQVNLDFTEKFQQAAHHTGYIKVELWFETDKPRHLSSFLLRDSFEFEGKLVESVSVLLKPEQVFDMSEAYWDMLERLKDAKIIPSDAEFFGYEIKLEDKQTLGWFVA